MTGFPKSRRILQSKDFRRVYDNGARFSSRLFTAFLLDLGGDRSAGPRLGLTVPRATGTAVERNRIKRRMRAAWRSEQSTIAARWDVVMNPRRAVLQAPFGEMLSEVRKLVTRCKLS